MSEAKEGKLFGRKKLLDPLLGTTEGTKISSTIIFYTSHALTVYSTAQLCMILVASSQVNVFKIIKLFWKAAFLEAHSSGEIWVP